MAFGIDSRVVSPEQLNLLVLKGIIIVSSRNEKLGLVTGVLFSTTLPNSLGDYL